jgi:hypothetical protein
LFRRQQGPGQFGAAMPKHAPSASNAGVAGPHSASQIAVVGAPDAAQARVVHLTRIPPALSDRDLPYATRASTNSLQEDASPRVTLIGGARYHASCHREARHACRRRTRSGDRLGTEHRRVRNEVGAVGFSRRCARLLKRTSTARKPAGPRPPMHHACTPPRSHDGGGGHEREGPKRRPQYERNRGARTGGEADRGKVAGDAGGALGGEHGCGAPQRRRHRPASHASYSSWRRTHSMP